MAEATRVSNLFEARLIVGLLEAHGIPALVRTEDWLGMHSLLTPADENLVVVEVAEGRVEEARRVIAERREAVAAAGRSEEE